MKTLNVRWVLFGVYGAVSVATFYHSMWGFATLAGSEPSGWIAAAMWWIIGALMAVAVDVGMAAIVYARATGNRQGWLVIALIVAGGASAYTQLIYAAHHATDYQIGEVAPWLQWLEVVLDARVVILPILLPAFALVYAFAAHDGGASAAQPAATQAQQPAQSWLDELRKPQAEPQGVAAPDPEPATPEIERNEPESVGIAPEPGIYAGATVDERRAQLPGLLKAHSQADIARMFDVDPATIYRDKKALNGAAK